MKGGKRKKRRKRQRRIKAKRTLSIPLRPGWRVSDTAQAFGSSFSFAMEEGEHERASEEESLEGEVFQAAIVCSRALLRAAPVERVVLDGGNGKKKVPTTAALLFLLYSPFLLPTTTLLPKTLFLLLSSSSLSLLEKLQSNIESKRTSERRSISLSLSPQLSWGSRRRERKREAILALFSSSITRVELCLERSFTNASHSSP